MGNPPYRLLAEAMACGNQVSAGVSFLSHHRAAASRERSERPTLRDIQVGCSRLELNIDNSGKSELS